MNRVFICIILFISYIYFGCSTYPVVPVTSGTPAASVTPVIPVYNLKISHIKIYDDSMYYSAFPSIIKKHDGELLLAFRRAPNRKISYTTHTDPESNLVMLRSRDGINWSKQPELIYAHPLGGSQDPCLLLLKNGTILCASYLWSFFSLDEIEKYKQQQCYIIQNSLFNAVFMGGYIVRSSDGGKTWQYSEQPPYIDANLLRTHSGDRIPAYNRGAMYQDENGRVYWAVAVYDSLNPVKSSVYLIVSDDNGITWNLYGKITSDPMQEFEFNETSVYKTPNGDIIAFIRGNTGRAYVARSKDGGKNFEHQEDTGFHAQPMNVLRLPDNSVLLTYGYRRPPYGIRAKILNAECTNFKEAEEIILRNDGDGGDIGYSWPVLLDDGKVLVVYYFNNSQGIRSIMGTIIEFERNTR